MRTEIIHGDSIETLPTLESCSIDSIVTDPPYELGFMGKAWDASGIAYNVELWRECLRVLKPGGHLLAFGGSRTYHRLACAVEDAGFEIRDQIMWVYGSGFPKSHNLKGDREGWGSALKPSHEPIVVARKPLQGTIAENVAKWGTGALNIDGTRVDMGDEYDPTKIQRQQNSAGAIDGAFGASALIGKEIQTYKPGGRWPANFIHDGSDEVLALAGDAARFFYCAKASKAERNAGLDTPSTHPTVKPIALMRYLIRLVTPPGGVVLDPFAGSGTTLVAATLENMSSIGIEMTDDYLPIIDGRVAWAKENKETDTLF